MKMLLLTIVSGVFFTGCTHFTFEPEGTAPKTELDQTIQNQENVMAEQENAALNK
jgi:hypothetical protein